MDIKVRQDKEIRFGDLLNGDCFRLANSETNALWMKIQRNESRNCVRVDSGFGSFRNEGESVVKVKGCFVEE